LVPKFQLMNY